MLRKNSKLTAHSSVDLETHLGELSELHEHDLPRPAHFQKCSNSAYTILNITPKRQERQCCFFPPAIGIFATPSELDISSDLFDSRG